MGQMIPPPLRWLLWCGLVVATGGLVGSALLSDGADGAAASCTPTGAVSPGENSFRHGLGGSCEVAWTAHCAATLQASSAQQLAKKAYRRMSNRYPKGSSGYAEKREAIEYLKATAEATPQDPTERYEVWRWVGVAIFISFCGGSAHVLLRRMRAAGLKVADLMTGWWQPFVGMLVGSNSLNIGFALLKDPRSRTTMNWESYCYGADLAVWWTERAIRLGCSLFWSFAFCTFWALGNYHPAKLDLDHSDGRCGVGNYVTLLQIWSVSVPVLVVVPAFGWASYVGRQPNADMAFALQWLIICLPILYGVWRLVQAGRRLRAAYRSQVAALGDYPTQRKHDPPADPTNPFLGDNGWTPVTAGLVLAGFLWSIIEWSGGKRAIETLGWW